VRDPQPASSR